MFCRILELLDYLTSFFYYIIKWDLPAGPVGLLHHLEDQNHE